MNKNIILLTILAAIVFAPLLYMLVAFTVLTNAVDDQLPEGQEEVPNVLVPDQE